MTESWLADVAAADFCYLSTRGRRTGNPHTIEIWFAAQDGVIYLMAGSRHRADWVRNLIHTPEVEVRFGTPDAPSHSSRARVVDHAGDPEADATARRLLAEKYDEWERGAQGRTLSGWARTALPVEIRFPD